MTFSPKFTSLTAVILLSLLLLKIKIKTLSIFLFFNIKTNQFFPQRSQAARSSENFCPQQAHFVTGEKERMNEKGEVRK